jgi:hypothetical protein
MCAGSAYARRFARGAMAITLGRAGARLHLCKTGGDDLIAP